MDILLKIAAVGVAASVMAMVLKKNSPEIALLLTVATASLIMFAAVEVISEVLDFLRTILEHTSLSEDIFGIVLKAVAIAIITKIASDVCKDAGQSASSSAIELVGSATVLYIALPLFETMIQMINSLV